MQFIVVPAIVPLDKANGDEFDVLVNEEIFFNLVQDKRLVSVHMATPCQSFTLARSPLLRDADHPKGLHGLQGADLGW